MGEMRAARWHGSRQAAKAATARSEAGRFAEHASGVAELAVELFDEVEPAGLAAFFLDVAQFHFGAAGGVFRR